MPAARLQKVHAFLTFTYSDKILKLLAQCFNNALITKLLNLLSEI
jgi:hypothetical protein